jgi:SAM-dependent MidA family methyltransferase
VRGGGAGAAGLPRPTPDALAHSQRLVAPLLARIGAAADAFLPFDEFMAETLYAPGLGYYAAGAAKLGEAGDFVTAPEISPLFGACLAVQAARVLEALGGGDIVEYGAGSGALARDLLGELARRGALPPRYAIVEVSPDLRARQRETLAALPGDARSRVCWLDGPPVAPLRGIVLANEVADAIPVQRFAIDARAPDRIFEEGVAAAGGDGPPGGPLGGPPGGPPAPGADPGRALRRALQPARPDVVAAVRELEARLGRALPDGYRSELAPRRDAWLATLADSIAEGMVLLVDYGLGAGEYYAPGRTDGTLICHYRHRAHDDPLCYPGLQDITAWVDFSALARTAQRCGLDVAGFTTQAGFLLGAGVDALAAQAFEAAPDETARVALSSGLRRLLLPGEMGERFRVLALTRGAAGQATAFQMPDLRRTL